MNEKVLTLCLAVVPVVSNESLYLAVLTVRGIVVV